MHERIVYYLLLPVGSDLFIDCDEDNFVSFVSLNQARRFYSLSDAVSVLNQLIQYSPFRDVVIGRYESDGEGECVYVI